MRVLFVCPAYPANVHDYDGLANLHSAAALCELGAEVHVLALRPWRPGLRKRWKPPSAPGVSVTLATYVGVPRLKLPGVSLLLLRGFATFQYGRVLRRFDPDVVHVHTERMALALRIDRRSLDLPTLLTLHAADRTPQIERTHTRRRRLARAFSHVGRIVIVGDVLKGYFAPHLRGIAVMTIHNGFHASGEGSTKLRIWSSPSMEIISVSRLHEGKGIQYTLLALSTLKDECEFRYRIVGEGPYEGALRRLVAELGLERHVEFLGPLAHDHVNRLLAEAHLFVLPSYFEAFGVAHLEAMAAGCVVVGVDGQGPSEYIVAGRTGYLVPPKSAASIADVIRQVAHDRRTAESIARAGSNFAFSDMTWGAHAQRVYSQYVNLVDGVS